LQPGTACDSGCQRAHPIGAAHCHAASGHYFTLVEQSH
jgi:hypothetical protein